VKRSQSVKRVLLGGLTAGAFSACALAAQPRVTPNNFYTNDDHIPGAGHYHAPFQGFFAFPYNHYDAARKLYFYGGQWGPEPHRSIVNISAPTPDAARLAESIRTDVQRTTTSTIPRSGFGSTSGSRFVPS
jgi:hypothetical protein